MAAEASTTAGNGERPPGDTDPRRLMGEALGLALILGLVLVVSAVERPGDLLGQGYLSAILLLGLSLACRRCFGGAVHWVRPRRLGSREPWFLATGLTALLLVSAWMPLAPQRGHGPAWWPSLCLLVLVPLSEELYFRGLLLDHLRRGFDATRAVLLTTLLFALLHLPVGAAPVAGALALIAGWLTIRTGALGCALQLHVAWNALSQLHRIGDAGARWQWALSAAILVDALAVCAGTGRGGTREPAR